MSKQPRGLGKGLGALLGDQALSQIRKPVEYVHKTVVTPESIVIPPAPVANDTLVAEVSDAPQANDPTFNNEDLA